MKNHRFVYSGLRFPAPQEVPKNYTQENFDHQLALESHVFYELRKRNGIKPYRLTDSTLKEKEDIRCFFQGHRDTFFLLFRDDTLAASVLWLGNYIQCLAVDPRFQGQGLGRLLTGWAVNRIYDAGYDRVELEVMEGNGEAEALYVSLGFQEVGM